MKGHAQKHSEENKIEAWAQAIRDGDRTALSRAITCVESSRPEDQTTAQALRDSLAPFSGQADRIGVTGPPGVGKSTFLEALGLSLVEQGHKIAVLAVDPSSSRTGGSILGDKTRMPRLSQTKKAFVRPSPSSGALGGVTVRTDQAIALCEAAGYNPIFVETVGVGQSEAYAADMTDCLILILAPGGGDSLQGLKKGLMEHADLLVVNKADGDMEAAALRTAKDYRTAVSLLPHSHHPSFAHFAHGGAGSPEPEETSWRAPVLTLSALTGVGIQKLWDTVMHYKTLMQKTGSWDGRRQHQRGLALERLLEERLLAWLKASPGAHKTFDNLMPGVLKGDIAPSRAAEDILKASGLPSPRT